MCVCVCVCVFKTFLVPRNLYDKYLMDLIFPNISLNF